MSTPNGRAPDGNVTQYAPSRQRMFHLRRPGVLCSGHADLRNADETCRSLFGRAAGPHHPAGRMMVNFIL